MRDIGIDLHHAAVSSVGLIGLGKMGLSHLAIANSTRGLRVDAICDKSRFLVSALRRNLGISGYTSFEKMVAAHDLDGVIISVPNAHHYSVAAYCIDKGLNVFIEKPMTLSQNDSDDLVRRASQKNVVGQVGYVNRFNPLFARARNLFVNGVIGRIEKFESNMTGGVVLKPNTSGWRNDYRRGGGCLFDYGPHCIDLVNYFVGGGAQVVSAKLEKVHSTSVDDAVDASLVCANGSSGAITINWSDPSVRKAENTFFAQGTKGSISVNKQELCIDLDDPIESENLTAGKNKIYITDCDSSVGFYLRGEDFSLQMEHFSDLMAGSCTTPVSSLVDAADVDRVVGHIFRAAGGDC